MFDIIIIGGGTAGMTAALYGLRAGKRVLVLEAENFGGQITFSPRVENYPGIPQISGNEFASGLLEQILALGAEVELDTVLEIREEDGDKLVRTETNDYRCHSIVLAIGTKHRPLGLDREEELAGHGISYCAVCDGAFFRDKTVAVVGGGNTALQSAAFLSSYCKKVFLIHRRNGFRGEEKAAERLREKNNVTVLLNTNVTQLLGEHALRGVLIQQAATGKTEELLLDGLFVAIGQAPNTTAFTELLATEKNGYFLAGEDCRTAIPGIFVAGDCRTKTVRQLTTAAADGAVAGLAASLYAEERAVSGKNA